MPTLHWKSFKCDANKDYFFTHAYTCIWNVVNIFILAIL